MRIIASLDGFQKETQKPLFLALGNFDGLHLGHQHILKRVIDQARQSSGFSGLFTFNTHPQAVLRPESKPPLLSTTQHKLFLLEQCGLDWCFHLSFTKEFSLLEPEAFVEKILCEKLGIGKLFLGNDAKFGHARKGDVALMKVLAAKYGFEFEVVAPVSQSGAVISSSRIRALAFEGKLAEARACLGRSYSILTEIIHGDGRGTGLGYPTANLKIDLEVLPPEGVYAVCLREVGFEPSTSKQLFKAGPWQSGVLNYGKRPTFHHEDGAPRVAEVFILDSVPQSLYGKHFEVAFIDKIREERTFPDAQALRQQIASDVEIAKRRIEKFNI